VRQLLSTTIDEIANRETYIERQGVERDYVMAKKLFERASDLGNLWAKRAVAAMTVSIVKDAATKIRGW
jgi:TPR repeat protein